MGKIILVLTLILAFACTTKPKENSKTTGVSTPVVSFELIKYNQGWGYKVYVNSKLYITQDLIPCVSGNNPFKNSADAQKVANLVVQKIEKGILPPTIALNELIELNVEFYDE